MAIVVVASPFGAAAYTRLHDIVEKVKADDRLAPVTVVVPANSVGVAARRSLARHGRGIAGASFVTLYRLAELLGGAELAGRGLVPVSNPAVAAAARRALGEVKGRYESVAGHEATELAFVRAHRELDDLDESQLARLAAASGRARDVVAVHRAMRRVLGRHFHTERDLLEAAAEVVARGRDAGNTPLAAIGTVVLFLPERVSEPGARFVRALSDQVAVHVVVGCTGSAELDASNLELAERLGAEPFADPEVPTTPIDRVVSVSDADDEARAVARRVIAAARRGVPLERIAILFANRDPYARMLHEHLDAAGIAHNGTAVRSLADSVAGRTVLGALALPDNDFRRSDVLGFATAAPIRHAGKPVLVARWERIARAAGVVEGLVQWRERLTRHAAVLGDEHHDHAPTLELRTFVEDLAARLASAQRARSWSDLARHARILLADALPGDRARAQWPDEEQRAYDRVQLAIDRLATLDLVEPVTGFDTFRRALVAELDADLGKVGRIGDGVLVGSLALAAGVETDVLLVVGMAEGNFPGRRRDDSLLPDADRAVLGAAILPDRRRRARLDERALRAALACCSTERVLFHPRGDLRRSVERPLSRYALDAVESVGGVRPRADELIQHHKARWLEWIPSFAAGVRTARFPATAQDLRLAHLGRRSASDALARHPIVVGDRALRRAVELLDARASDEFTRFDGNLSARRIPPVTRGWSPSRLETYASNPFEYFLGYVLGLELVTDPATIERIEPIELGNLLHEVLERFVYERAIADGQPTPARSGPWTDDDRIALHQLADDICDHYEQRGLTGRPLLWRQDRRRIHIDLDEFVARDNEHRAAHGCAHLHVELHFGRPVRSGYGVEYPAVPMILADGREITLIGSADRVARRADGGLCVVDYKSGSNRNFPPFDAADPHGDGTRLQLPIYAYAIRACLDAPDAEVDAAYWFVTERGEYRQIVVPFTPEVEQSVVDVITRMVALIEAGIFPNAVDPPDSWGRTFASLADPDARGNAAASRVWARKQPACEQIMRSVLARAGLAPGVAP